jgi:hypothetical protein
MKAKIRIIIVLLTVISFGTASGQDEFIALSSSQFLKGLENQDGLRQMLTDNGFTLTKKWKVQNFKGGIYEYWEYKGLVFVDMILKRGQQADIIVRIFDEVKDLPERLLETFPYNRTEMMDDDLSKVNLTRFRKDKAYSLMYSKNERNIGVYVWYDEPFYYFEYTTVQ